MTPAHRASLLALLFLAFGCRAAEPPLVKLRYGQAYSSVNSIFSLPVAVAEREGLFRREGLDFRLVIPIPGGSDKMIDALHDGTVDVTHVATPFLIRAALAGSDAVAIAAEFNNPIYSLVARPEIRSFADLRGRQLGLADPAGSITLSMVKLLALHGVGKDDIRARTIEGTPTRLACLKRGKCAAVPLGQPQDLLARSEGYRILGLSNEAVPELLYTVTAARRSWAAAHQDAVVRYVRALAAAFQVIRDPARRAAVVRIIVDSTGVPAAIAEQTLALYFEPERGVLPRRAEIEMKGLERMIALMGEGGLLKAPPPAAERFVDLQYLRAVGIR